MLSTLVAIGPWITSRSTGIASPPNALTTSWPGSIVLRDRRQGGAEDAEPDGRDELAEHAAEVELAARHAPRDEPRVVRGVGEPGDAPADADRGHQGGQRAPQRLAVQVAAGVAPVDVGLVGRPGHDRHRQQHEDRDRHRPALEAGDRPEADRGQPDLDRHDHDRDRDLEPVAAVDADLVEERDDQVEDDPGVDRAPADGQQALQGGREVGAAPAERRA